MATEGDDDFYDSDEYDPDDLPSGPKATGGATATSGGDDWGAPKRGGDGWGSQPQAPSAKAAGGEGRLVPVEEARRMLKEMDVATSKAQGWLRGTDAARRLAAMRSLVGAYPDLYKREKVEARNPMQMLRDAFWQAPPHKQARTPLAALKYSTLWHASASAVQHCTVQLFAAPWRCQAVLYAEQVTKGRLSAVVAAPRRHVQSRRAYRAGG